MKAMKYRPVYIALLAFYMIANLAYAGSISAEMLSISKIEQTQSMEDMSCHGEPDKDEESQGCYNYDCSNCASGNAISSNSINPKTPALSATTAVRSIALFYSFYSDNLYRPPIIS